MCKAGAARQSCPNNDHVYITEKTIKKESEIENVWIWFTGPSKRGSQQMQKFVPKDTKGESFD